MTRTKSIDRAEFEQILAILCDYQERQKDLMFSAVSCHETIPRGRQLEQLKQEYHQQVMELLK